MTQNKNNGADPVEDAVADEIRRIKQEIIADEEAEAEAAENLRRDLERLAGAPVQDIPYEESEPIRGIFDNAAPLMAVYEGELQFEGRIMGGTPKNPKVLEQWIGKNTGIDDKELQREIAMRSLKELGVSVDENISFEDLMKAAEEVAALNNTVGFKRNSKGLYIESRYIKACLREAVNILYAGVVDDQGRRGVGAGGKGAKAYVAERVFVEPEILYLEHNGIPLQEPTGKMRMIGHVTGAQGTRSTITDHEYVLRPTVRFRVSVTKDVLTEEAWATVWLQAQMLGLGALRSQDQGRFKLLAWQRVKDAGKTPKLTWEVRPPAASKKKSA